MNDYELTIKAKTLKGILGEPFYRKLAAGILKFGAPKDENGERPVFVSSIPLASLSRETRAAILSCSEKKVQPVICAKNKKFPQARRKGKTGPALSELTEVIAGIRQLLNRLERQVPENRCRASHFPHQGDTNGYFACIQNQAATRHQQSSVQCHCRFCRSFCLLGDEGL